MSQMYPDISKEKESSTFYPDLSDFEENSFYIPTQPVLRKHSEIQKSPKLDPVTENDDETKGSSSHVYKYIIAIVTFFASLLFLVLKNFQSSFQHQEPTQSLPLYLEEIEKLRPHYGQQTDEFWNTIKSFPYSLLTEKNPEGPAVLLMVTPAGGLSLALQLTKRLAHTLTRHLDSNPKHLKFVEGASLTFQSPDIQKVMIDEQIRTLVDNYGQRAVVVVNLEKIDPKAVMIFHAYCDNSEAVYKNIAIILLLELPARVHAKNNEDVYDHLSQIWSPLGRSRNHALLTRMANNIAILKTK